MPLILLLVALLGSLEFANASCSVANIYWQTSLGSCKFGDAGTCSTASNKCDYDKACSCESVVFQYGIYYTGGSLVGTFVERCAQSSSLCLSFGSGVVSECLYTISCSTKAEADSVSCVINGSQWTGTECRERKTFGCRDSVMSGGQTFSVIDSAGTYKNLYLGSCAENGYCASGVTKCTYDSVKCERTGKDKNEPLCYYKCSDGNAVKCKSTPVQTNTSTPQFYCPSQPDSSCAPNVYEDFSPQYSENGFGSPADSTGSDSLVGGSGDDGEQDYSLILKAIHDTLHIANNNNRAQTYYQWQMDSIMQYWSYGFDQNNSNISSIYNSVDGVEEELRRIRQNGDTTNSMWVNYWNDFLTYSENMDSARLTMDSILEETKTLRMIAENGDSVDLTPVTQRQDSSLGLLDKVINYIGGKVDSCSTEDYNEGRCRRTIIGSLMDIVNGLNPISDIADLVGDIAEWFTGDDTPIAPPDSLDLTEFNDREVDSTSVFDTNSVELVQKLDSATWWQDSGLRILDRIPMQETIDRMDSVRESLMDTTQSDTISVDSLGVSADDIRNDEAYSFLWMDESCSEGCYKFEHEINLGIVDPFVFRVDFGNFGGVNLCRIVKECVGVFTLLIVLMMNIRIWRGVFGGGDN